MKKREKSEVMTRQVLQKGSFKYQKLVRTLWEKHIKNEYFYKKVILIYAGTMKSKHKMEDCVKPCTSLSKLIAAEKKITTSHWNSQ